MPLLAGLLMSAIIKAGIMAPPPLPPPLRLTTLLASSTFSASLFFLVVDVVGSFGLLRAEEAKRKGGAEIFLRLASRLPPKEALAQKYVPILAPVPRNGA